MHIFIMNFTLNLLRKRLHVVIDDDIKLEK